MDKDKYKFATKAIRGGIKGKHANNALNPPIYQTSTFVFDNLDHVEKVMSFESDDYVYTRGNNPSLRLFENKMAILEEGEGAVAFSSGMGAISSVLFSLTKPGDHLIGHKTLYGSTYNVIDNLLAKHGVKSDLVDLTDLSKVKDKINKNTRLIYFESPSNPNLAIINIKEVVKIARDHGLKVIVDNTFATPYFQRPLALGVDIVVHSATKYISGHGDAMGGVAVAKDMDYIQYLKFDYMCELGTVMSPFNAWLMVRGLKTLGLRMREHEKNAIRVADFLSKHRRVKKVYYPGLKGFPGHEIAREQMDGFGGMISFEIHGDLGQASKFVDSLELAQLAVSLGDCETLVEFPAAMTHRAYPREDLPRFGLSETMVRLSVGLEDSEDIIRDLDRALDKI